MDRIVIVATRTYALLQDNSATLGDIALKILRNDFVQFTIVTLLVWITLKVIARVYSGDLQNTPIGPIALRSHTGEQGDKLQQIWAPKVLLPSTMNGAPAYCQFLYAYDDADGERRYVPLNHQLTKKRKAKRRRFLFQIRERRFAKDDGEYLGREWDDDDVRSEEIILSNPDAKQDTASATGAATPMLAKEWLEQQGPRDLRLSSTEIVSVPDGTRDALAEQREEFISSRVKAIRTRKRKWPILRAFDGNLPETRPSVIGYYYMKVSFDTSTWFVLFHHPDRELKMTAWLTVLTSMFGFLIGKLP